jgi:hypothetical protein
MASCCSTSRSIGFLRQRFVIRILNPFTYTRDPRTIILFIISLLPLIQGYYAIVGKMSKEEENRLLLDVVSAFSHVPDIDPAVSCERSSSLTFASEVIELGQRYNATNTLQEVVNEADESDIQIISKGNVSSGVFATEASMAYIPEELRVNPWLTGLQVYD